MAGVMGVGDPLAHSDDTFQLLFCRDHRKNGSRFKVARLVGNTEVGTADPYHRGSHIGDVGERTDDDLRAFGLEAFAALICSMHKGGDGKAFFKELKSNGHTRFSGSRQNKDFWFIHSC